MFAAAHKNVGNTWSRCLFTGKSLHVFTCACFRQIYLCHNVEFHVEDIQWFDVEYGIYCTSETGYFLFSRLWSTSENIRLSCLTSEMNSVFNVKPMNVLFITFSLVFQILHTSTACKIWRDVTIVCNFHTFHTVKITPLIFSHWENNSPWNISLNNKKRIDASVTERPQTLLVPSEEFVSVFYVLCNKHFFFWGFFFFLHHVLK